MESLPRDGRRGADSDLGEWGVGFGSEGWEAVERLFLHSASWQRRRGEVSQNPGTGDRGEDDESGTAEYFVDRGRGYESDAGLLW